MDLFDFLKTQNELVILGSGREELDVYDLLIGKNIDVCCFVNDNYSEQSHKMFGKNIISSIDARNKYKKPIFIECSNKYSAWGFGGVDYYDYIGYRRNKNFFLIKDYIDIKENSLQNILSNKKIVLAGHIELCEYLYKYLVLKKYQICGHLVDGQKNNNWEQGKMPEIYPKDVDKDTVCLMVAQEDYLKEGGKRKQLIDLEVYVKQNELDDYTEYFSYMESLIEIEQCNRKKYTKKALIPRKIVLGSIEGNSGNAFFRGLLDNHPSILMINHCNFSDSLFRYCIILSMKDSNNILSDFWKMYKKEQEQAEIFDPDAFNSKMNQLLSLYKSFSPQELFVVFHVAFMYMRGREIAVNDIKNMLIYWEPHNVDRKLLEDCAKWLGDEQVNCDIINVVRNKVMSSGDVKRILLTSNDVRRAFTVVLNYPSIDKKDFLWCDRLVVKFEDIKCNPHDVLFGICKQWGIEWSDTLMTTTSNGEKIWHTNRDYTVCDFDLKPVYNLNEKYFSEFDRFRIMLINAPWLRKYEYPYVNMVQFTRRELYDMFSKRFRFEKMISYQSKKLEDEFKIELFFFIRAKLQKVRMMEIIGEYNF